MTTLLQSVFFVQRAVLPVELKISALNVLLGTSWPLIMLAGSLAQTDTSMTTQHSLVWVVPWTASLVMPKETVSLVLHQILGFLSKQVIDVLRWSATLTAKFGQV